MKFSANLGFLWQDRALPDAIRTAKAAGFNAVECHWPYDTPASDVATALKETGLPMLGLNTVRGNVAGGENGLSALPGRDAEARAAIDQAVDYAEAVDARAIHVMAGFASGQDARTAFVNNLKYACEKAPDRTILIEPLNHYDAPGYFLQTSGQAVEIIEEVASSNLKLMFDCYHLQMMEGDLTHRLQKLQSLIGHIQIASVPDRGTPDHGELNYAHLFEVIKGMGYDAPLGAEYKPTGSTDDSLGWLDALQ